MPVNSAVYLNDRNVSFYCVGNASAGAGNICLFLLEFEKLKEIIRSICYELNDILINQTPGQLL